MTTLATPRPAATPQATAALRSRRRMSGERLALLVFLLPALIYLILFFGYPLALNVYMSFTEYGSRSFITGEAPFVGLDNYITVLQDKIFSRALWNTLLFTFVSVAFQIILGMGGALLLAKRPYGSRVMSALVLLPWLFPFVITATIWKWILAEGGALGDVAALFGIANPLWLTDPATAIWAIILINIWAGLPFNIVILASGLRDVPPELHEAAALDGAGSLRRFWHITLPSLRGLLLVVTVLGLVLTLKVLDLILILTGGGPANSTQTLAMLAYQASFANFDFGEGAAIGNILILLTLVFAIAYAFVNRRSEEAS
ncbi:carbohydrate ABC transporter permease [Microbacterium sp. 18062]|uniref:carbohydrate ABC transporter permease n=1 Tax=Microbacterium sp. 18062 TaxID=2681410 RepID=UPI00135854F4|nr:sugar ABC transporter permease [Microbacterium sp. 18062]